MCYSQYSRLCLSLLLSISYVFQTSFLPTEYLNKRSLERVDNYFPKVVSLTSSYSGYDRWFTSAEYTTIPLLRVGRIFLIESEVDGEKGYLAFDTGASGLVINETYFRNRLRINSQSANGLTGSVGDIKSILVHTVEFYGIKFTSVTADLVNLGHIENRLGKKILGLIGFSLLKNFEVVFDPSLNQLNLYRVDKKGERIKSSSERFLADFTSSFEFKNNILFLKVEVINNAMRFCLDTGAETNVIDKGAPKNVINSITITRRSTVFGTGSNRSEVLFGSMNGFRFGSKNFDNLETIIANLESLSEAYETKIDGMLGYSFISKGVFCFNFVKKELSISYIKEEEQ